MPVEARVGRVRVYRFDTRVYTEAYLKEAVVVMLNELNKRTDLDVTQRQLLEQMHNWFLYPHLSPE